MSQKRDSSTANILAVEAALNICVCACMFVHVRAFPKTLMAGLVRSQDIMKPP